MNPLARLLSLIRRPPTLRPRPRHETTDERAARKYWDAQVADDHAKRGVSDDHP